MQEEEAGFQRAAEPQGVLGARVELQEGWVEEGLQGVVPRR